MFDGRKTMTKKAWKELQKKNRVSFKMNLGIRTMGETTRAKQKAEVRRIIKENQI